MTKPENPEPAEADDRSPLGADGAIPPPVGEEPDVPAAAQVESAAAPDGSAAVPATNAAEEPPAGDPPQRPTGEYSAPDDPLGDGSPNGSSTRVPSARRGGTSAADGGPSTVRLQLGEPESSRGAEAAKMGHQRPLGRVYGYPSNSGPGPAAAATRYGQPVAQPFDVQPSSGSGAGRDHLTGPTVRIGGRVQSEQGAAQQALSTRVRPARIPRRTILQVRYLEPWSVLKVSLVLSVAGFLAWMVAVGVLYNILGGMGVWDQLNGTYSDLTSVSDSGASQNLITAGGVFSVAAVVGLVNIVLITAMCTVGAFIYNASTDLAGGIEITLSERD
ncbi:MAG: DUF3566 domain-containing protein [Pseudonocardiaceae bacterium]